MRHASPASAWRRAVRPRTPRSWPRPWGYRRWSRSVPRCSACPMVRRWCSMPAAASHRECRTADGTRIEVLANIGSVAEAQAAVRNGAEGCGLLRTEFLFLDRQSPPTEAEQGAEYQRISEVLGARPL